jgi:hypothetical protein
MLTTCADVTVIPALPLRPPLAATMVAVPTATPVTIPVPDTVAMASLLDDHVISRPVKVAPPASRSVAVNVVVAPA